MLIELAKILTDKTNLFQVIKVLTRKKMSRIIRGILAFSGLVALILAYFVWTQPLETLKILVALNLLITGIGQLLRSIFFPDLE